MIEPQEAADLVVLHALMLQRYSEGVARRIVATLNRADKDIFSRLQLALDAAPGDVSAQAAYLESLLASVRGLNGAAYRQIEAAMQADMLALAGVETTFNDRLYGAMAGSVPLAAVGARSAYAAAMARPFQGVLLREAAAELGEARMRRIRDAVRIGFVSGKTTTQIVKDLRGTQTAGLADGLLEVDRRHLTTVVHSALGHTAATARDQFFKANKDVIASVMWLSTLDGKTSEPCRLRGNKRYSADAKKPIGHALPWGAGPGRYHFRCRSTAIGLLPGQEKPFGMRASSDGPVDANTSYGAWLGRQSEFTQNEVLGVKRAKLFRDGGLSIENFSTNKGEFISLEQLRKTDADAFKRAGL
jgi:hypothetical protein